MHSYYFSIKSNQSLNYVYYNIFNEFYTIVIKLLCDNYIIM